MNAPNMSLRILCYTNPVTFETGQLRIRWTAWRHDTKWLMIGRAKVIRMTRGKKRDKDGWTPIKGAYFYYPWKTGVNIASGYTTEVAAERVALRWLGIK